MTDIADSLPTLAVFRENISSMVMESVLSAQPIDWILEMADEVMGLMHDNGKADADTLTECRNAIRNDAITAIEQHGVGAVLRFLNGKRQTTGYIYAVQSADGLVKVGRTIEPSKRLNAIRTQTGKNLQRTFVSGRVPNYGAIELKVHKQFASSRTVGEWFAADFDIVQQAIVTLSAQQ